LVTSKSSSLKVSVITTDKNDYKEDSFETLSTLFKSVGYPTKEVKNALKKIASNQATLKSLDGVAHQFKHVTGDR
jgi:Holliday junction resolvasome RuvABC DNA-binding subunit